MNTFITPNNQKLLWQTISQSPLFSEKLKKEEWFRNIIGQFYESNKLNTMITLKDINIATIKFMMNKLKEENLINVRENDVRENDNLYTKEHISNLRKNEFDEKLRSLENEHNTLLKKEIPPEIDFRDKIDEGPIANIGDLIKMEIQKRNREISEYAIKEVPQAISHISVKPNVFNSSNSLNNDNAKKSVSWSSPTASEYSNIPEIKKVIEPCIQKINKLDEEVSSLKEEIVFLKEKLSELQILTSSNSKFCGLEDVVKYKETLPTPPPTLPEDVPPPQQEDVPPPQQEDVPPPTPQEDVPSPLPTQEDVPLPQQEDVPLPTQEDVPLPQQEDVPPPTPQQEDVVKNVLIEGEIETVDDKTKQLTIMIPSDNDVIDVNVPKIPRNKKNKNKK